MKGLLFQSIFALNRNRGKPFSQYAQNNSFPRGSGKIFDFDDRGALEVISCSE